MEIIQGTKKHNNRPISGATISCNHLNSKGARANELEHDAAVIVYSETRRVEPQRLPHHKNNVFYAMKYMHRNETNEATVQRNQMSPSRVSPCLTSRIPYFVIRFEHP